MAVINIRVLWHKHNLGQPRYLICVTYGRNGPNVVNPFALSAILRNSAHATVWDETKKLKLWYLFARKAIILIFSVLP